MDTGRITSSQIQQPQIPGGSVSKKPGEEKGIFEKIGDYFEPRPTTMGGAQDSSALRAAFGGGLQGFFTGGPQTAIGGAVGGYTGVKTGEKTGSLNKALTASATAGAGATLVAAGTIAAVMAGPAGVALYILAAAAIGVGGSIAGSAIEALKQHFTGKEIPGQEKAQPEETEEPSGSAEVSDEASGSGPQAAPAEKTFMGRVKDLADKGWDKVKDVAGSLFEKYGTMGASGLTGALIGAGIAMLGGPLGLGVAAVTGAASGVISSVMAKEANKNNYKLPAGKIAENTLLSTIMGTSGATMIGAGAFALAASNPATVALALGATAIMGSMTGMAGTLSGSKSSKISDGSTWGFTGGLLTKSFTGIGSTLTPLAAGIGSALGARAETKAGKAARGALIGGALGAVTGAFGGVVGMAVCATLGAVLSAGGAVFGGKLQQGIRNLTEDIRLKITPAMNKVSGKLIDVLGRKYGLIANGALAGALGNAPMGIMGAFVLGPAGAVLPSVAGAVMGGIRMAKMSKDIDNLHLLRDVLENAGPTMEDMSRVICASAFPRIEKTMTNATMEEKRQYFEQYVASTAKEMKDAPPMIAVKSREIVSNALFGEVKSELKTIKSDKEKQKLLEERITKAKPVIAQMMAGQFLNLLESQEAVQPAPSQSPEISAEAVK